MTKDKKQYEYVRLTLSDLSPVNPSLSGFLLAGKASDSRYQARKKAEAALKKIQAMVKPFRDENKK